MNSLKNIGLAAGIVTLVSLASQAVAQTGPTSGTSVPPAPSSVPIVSGQIANHENLAVMLRNLGCEVQVRTFNGTNGPRSDCLVVCRRDNYTYAFEADLMNNNSSLWLMGLVGTVELDRATPALLTQLMEANERHGPLHFSYRKSDHQLLLNLCLKNRDLTPELVQAEMDRFFKVVRETQPTWAAINLSASVQQPAPIPAVQAAPSGTPTAVRR